MIKLGKKIFFVIVLLIVNVANADSQFSCLQFYSGKLLFKKSRLLGLDRYSREEFLKNEFTQNSNSGPSAKYVNLKTTAPFNPYSNSSMTVGNISSKLFFSAKTAMKKYEEDSRQSTHSLVTIVLYEPGNQLLNGADSPWAVLIGKKNLNSRGKYSVSPMAIYFLESSNTGAVKLITDQFDSLII